MELKNQKIANGGVLLCAIGKCENIYAKEFVEHYKNIGVSKIVIYDNNDNDGERFEDVLYDYVNDGFVEIINYRGRIKPQRQAYTECYMKYGDKYAWLMFFDFDEFLVIRDGRTVDEWLSDKRYEGYQSVSVNWMLFGDGGMVRSDGRPVCERITEPCDFDIKKHYDFPENNHVKSIVRGGLKKIEWKYTPHVPSTKINICNTNGEKISNTPFCDYVFDVAYLKHFVTKTIDEYISLKLVRGGGNSKNYRKMPLIDEFFKINKYTVEKQNIINEYSKKYPWLFDTYKSRGKNTRITENNQKKEPSKNVNAQSDMSTNDIVTKVIRNVRDKRKMIAQNWARY